MSKGKGYRSSRLKRQMQARDARVLELLNHLEKAFEMWSAEAFAGIAWELQDLGCVVILDEEVGYRVLVPMFVDEDELSREEGMK